MTASISSLSAGLALAHKKDCTFSKSCMSLATDTGTHLLWAMARWEHGVSAC